MNYRIAIPSYKRPKIIKHNEDAYRNSLIFYPLSGFDK